MCFTATNKPASVFPVSPRKSISQMPREYDHDILAPPEPGLFLMRLVKKGPKVAARIHFENGLWQAEINGQKEGPAVADYLDSRSVMRIWETGTKTDQAAYDYHLAMKDWAEKHDPTHPAARVREPVNLAEMRPLWD